MKHQEPIVRRVLIIGCGLIGTSIGLALRRPGIEVLLEDSSAAARAQAALMGAGTAPAAGGPRADVVVIATPPSTVAAVLRDAQARDLGAAYTDVASTKARLIAEAEAAGCDLTTFVPGHPMAGRELSGPAGAQAVLFEGRRWALCPGPDTDPGLVGLVRQMATLCGGSPILLGPDAHDQIVAAVSHAPHLVSSAVAARFTDVGDPALSLVGQGLCDMTRIAAGPSDLWRDILEHNAERVAAVLEAVAADLAGAAGALRAEHGPGATALTDLLLRGNRGRAHIVATSPGRAPATAQRAAA